VLTAFRTYFENFVDWCDWVLLSARIASCFRYRWYFLQKCFDVGDQKVDTLRTLSALQVWMCGGTIEQVPCSRIGHIFRTHSPYSFQNGTSTHRKNSIRLAEVWMDDYNNFYYDRFSFNLVRTTHVHSND
jgi:hypothetical protein